MNWTDAVLVALLVITAVDGYRRGFILHTADVFTLVPAIYLTVAFSPDLADWMVMERDADPLKARIISPVAIFIGVQAIGAVIVWLLYRVVPEEVRDSRSNHVAGIVPAVLKSAAYAAVVLAVIAAVPAPRAQQAVHGSALGPPLAEAGRTMAGWLGLSINQAVERAFKNLTVSNKPTHTSHERIPIPAVTEDWKLRPEPGQEQEMLRLVNEERKRAGVPPLHMDDSLCVVARAHSRDMWMRGYFAHEDPDGRDVADRVRAAHISYEIVGENIALSPSLAMAHEGLMNSPDHRANILEPRYRRVGMGIVLGGSNGIMVTQNFRN